MSAFTTMTAEEREALRVVLHLTLSGDAESAGRAYVKLLETVRAAERERLACVCDEDARRIRLQGGEDWPEDEETELAIAEWLRAGGLPVTEERS